MGVHKSSGILQRYREHDHTRSSVGIVRLLLTCLTGFARCLTPEYSVCLGLARLLCVEAGYHPIITRPPSSHHHLTPTTIAIVHKMATDIFSAVGLTRQRWDQLRRGICNPPATQNTSSDASKEVDSEHQHEEDEDRDEDEDGKVDHDCDSVDDGASCTSKSDNSSPFPASTPLDQLFADIEAKELGEKDSKTKEPMSLMARNDKRNKLALADFDKWARARTGATTDGSQPNRHKETTPIESDEPTAILKNYVFEIQHMACFEIWTRAADSRFRPTLMEINFTCSRMGNPEQEVMSSMIDTLIDIYDKSLYASHSEMMTYPYPKTEEGSNDWWRKKINHYNDCIARLEFM